MHKTKMKIVTCDGCAYELEMALDYQEEGYPVVIDEHKGHYFIIVLNKKATKWIIH